MPWIQLQIPADPDNADQLEDLLMEMGAEAVSMEDAADQPLYEPDPGTTPLWHQTSVTGLFGSDRDIEELCAAVTRCLAPADPTIITRHRRYPGGRQGLGTGLDG